MCDDKNKHSDVQSVDNQLHLIMIYNETGIVFTKPSNSELANAKDARAVVDNDRCVNDAMFMQMYANMGPEGKMETEAGLRAYRSKITAYGFGGLGVDIC